MPPADADVHALRAEVYAASADAEDPRTRLGREGEQIAARHLARHGYRILRRNFRARHGGEVDLVCRDVTEGVLVFVEVKTRTSEEHGSPAQAVNPAKQRLIVRGALEWMRLLDRPETPCRFDVVEVIVRPGQTPEIRVIRDAFPLPEPYLS